MKKQYLSKRKERRGRERRRRAFKFTRERLFVRSRARMGNQSTSKTSPFLSGAPIGMNPLPRAPPQFNLLQNNFVDSARDLGKKLPRDPLSSSLRLPKRPSRPLLMPRNRSGHIPPPPPPPLRRLAGSAAAASGSGGGRICKGFTSDLEGLRLIRGVF